MLLVTADGGERGYWYNFGINVYFIQVIMWVDETGLMGLFYIILEYYVEWGLFCIVVCLNIGDNLY